MPFANAYPDVDTAHQAVDALRGYDYQAMSAALAWIHLDPNAQLLLEVAEDYAEVRDAVLSAIQVKDSGRSGSITLSSSSAQNAVAAFVDLIERNPDRDVYLRVATTSRVGRERALSVELGVPGIEYWNRVRSGTAEPEPLLHVLRRDFPEAVSRFVVDGTDETVFDKLIGRVYWDCARPDSTGLRRQLEGDLKPILREKFNLPSRYAPSIADQLIYRVLHKSALPLPQNRVLTPSELHDVIDSATQVSLPVTTIEHLLRSLPVSPNAAGTSPAMPVDSRSRPQWLIDGTSVPDAKNVVPRPTVHASVRSVLEDTSVCVLFGATGVGKSVVARGVAASLPKGFQWAHFRDADRDAARARLDTTLTWLAGMDTAALIIEDLNVLEDAMIQVSLSQVVEAARRHDMRVLITCYSEPSPSLMDALGFGISAGVQCPHFTEEETHSLVVEMGGDPAIWGRVAYVAGASGHPLLTHAFAAGLAARAWPQSEIPLIVAQGLRTSDLDSAREAARAHLIATLPQPARDLLYRLSISIGFFTRRLALAIGSMDPPISRVGECFDLLSGPWIEALGNSRYRLSPLVQGSGQATLPSGDQRRLHNAIANEMLADAPADARDIDAILTHALAGDAGGCLAQIAHFVVTAADDVREALARHLVAFRLLNVSRPPYAKDPLTSVLLRLAQFRLIAASDQDAEPTTAKVVDALLHELDGLPPDPERPEFESGVIGSILNTLGIAARLPGWIDVLHRFHRLEEESHSSQPDPVPSQSAVFFSIGISGLDSVSKLHRIFDDLNTLEPEVRDEFLTPIDANYADHFLVVHHAWSSEARRTDFDPSDAVNRYRQMAELASDWDNQKLALQCYVAAAAILVEHQDDPTSSFLTLDQARARFGDDPILARARAKLHHRIGDHSTALPLYKDVFALDANFGGAADATYVLREAAITAAKCEEWQLAREWFLRARDSARALRSIGHAAMPIGLSADAAVAAFEMGDLQAALRLLAEALDDLADLDPDSGLHAAHCHRLVRHTALWLQTRVDDQSVDIDGAPITMSPGMCSNPEPSKQISELPLGHIDFAWYILAQIEASSSFPPEIRDRLPERTRGKLPAMEFDLRLRTMQAAIAALDVSALSDHCLEFAAVYVYVDSAGGLRRFSADPLNPEVHEIPPIDATSSHPALADIVVYQGMVAFAVQSLLQKDRVPGPPLADGMEAYLGHGHPAIALFRKARQLSAAGNDIYDELSALLPHFGGPNAPSPDLLWLASARLLHWCQQTIYSPVALPHLSSWLRKRWRRAVQTQRAVLRAPRHTVPPIERILDSGMDGTRFAATLLLAAVDAVNMTLSADFRASLSQLADTGSQ